MSTSTPLHDRDRFDFGSDNYAGVHPQVLAALVEANGGHTHSYGDDPYTQRLADWARSTFGERARIYPVFNGTGANVVALQSMLPRWGAVLAAPTAHIATDEGGAPERVAGIKIITLPQVNGRIDPADIAPQRIDPDEVHQAHPCAVSISNTTELGSVYSPEQTRAIADAAHAAGMHVHLDGSRLANAAAATGASLQALTVDAGVDVVSLGATKNGALAAEAVVVIDPDAVAGIEFIRKFDMQLASKQRFLSAQLLALFDGDLWLDNARHANAMAQLLGERLQRLPGIEVPHAPEANAVFARIPGPVVEAVRREFAFYDWPGEPGLVRLMAAWDTPATAVDAFVATVERARSRA